MFSLRCKSDISPFLVRYKSDHPGRFLRFSCELTAAYSRLLVVLLSVLKPGFTLRTEETPKKLRTKALFVRAVYGWCQVGNPNELF